jgi:tetraspanin-5
MARSRRQDRTEVSCCIKYLVFGFNVFFWLIGIAACAAGFYAWVEKDTLTNLSKLSRIPLDPALVLIIVGGIMFILGFAGCVGALRENTTLLLFFSFSVGLILFLELATGILLFLYKDWVKEQAKVQFNNMIVNYREDPDLQNLIDWVQEKWLRCCGVEGPRDWESNMYFNCSKDSRSKNPTEACGVPYSCCKRPKNTKPYDYETNKQCGYGVLADSKALSTTIYSDGCIEAGEKWLEANLIPVACVAVGVALLQILGICFAQNLRSDIFAQMAKWR